VGLIEGVGFGRRSEADDVAQDELTLGAVVTGLEESGLAKLEEALDDASFPDIGDAPPDSAFTHLTLQDVRLMELTATAAKFDLIYRGRDTSSWGGGGTVSNPVIEVGASVSQVQANTDGDGNPIFVEYTDANGNVHRQPGTVAVMVPQAHMTRTYTTEENPMGEACHLTGCINANSFKSAPAGYRQARCWLCTGVVGRSQDNGDTWHVTETYQYDKDEWQAVVVYIDPNTGKPPIGIAKGNGIAKVDVYKDEIFP